MRKLLHIVIGTLLFSAFACVDHNAGAAEARKQLIAEGVQIKLSEFRAREWAECIERARQQAVTEVDSMIRIGARNDAIEPVIKPPKPLKPPKPDIKTLPDSLKEKAGKEDGE